MSPYRNRKDAVKFEALRQEYGVDECEAWVEFTKWKREIGERREVIACDMYDFKDGASERWSLAKPKKYVL